MHAHGAQKECTRACYGRGMIRARALPGHAGRLRRACPLATMTSVAAGPRQWPVCRQCHAGCHGFTPTLFVVARWPACRKLPARVLGTRPHTGHHPSQVQKHLYRAPSTCTMAICAVKQRPFGPEIGLFGGNAMALPPRFSWQQDGQHAANYPHECSAPVPTPGTIPAKRKRTRIGDLRC